MSHNSKNSKRIQAAKEMSRQRLNGGSGASKTTPLHGKKNAFWQRFPSYEAYIKSVGGSSNTAK